MIDKKKKELGLNHLTDKEIIMLALRESTEISKELKDEIQTNNIDYTGKVLNKKLVCTLSNANKVLLNYISR